MTETQEVVFDSTSGISIEEQKEILSKINGITEKNRRQLSKSLPGASAKNMDINAKKSGALFPIIVNAFAVVILTAGCLLLISFNGRKDAQVREGGAVYNLTERALIDEIRKDTADKIAAKEKEINSIASRLEYVDAQLMQLYSSNQELTAEQLAAQERLLLIQNAFRTELSALHDERSQILEDSRMKEARLRVQLEERAREFAAAQQKNSSELDSAMRELERLTSEQDRAAAIDAQIAGGLAAIKVLVQGGQYDQAIQIVENLKLFCNNNAVSSSRAFQTRREFYNQAINSMEAMIVQVRKNSGAGDAKEQWDLQVKISQLEEQIAGMEKTISAFSSDSSGQASRLVELEESVSSMRAVNSSLETAAAEKDKTMSSLETERVNLNQTVSDLKSVNANQEKEIQNLRSQLSIIRQALQEE